MGKGVVEIARIDEHLSAAVGCEERDDEFVEQLNVEFAERRTA